jgi:HD-GYP domain-containing protein (c-di-GMP phosphodiesterase class II)
LLIVQRDEGDAVGSTGPRNTRRASTARSVHVPPLDPGPEVGHLHRGPPSPIRQSSGHAFASWLAAVQKAATILSAMAETSGAPQRARTGDSGVRLAELMAALSMATDLGMGQPLESALCSCVVAMRLGEALGLNDDALRDVYYQALLRYIGCNADTYAMAALFGDELALRHDFARVDPGQPPEVLGVAVRYMREASAGEPPYRMAAFVARGLLSLPRLMADSFAGHCEVAQRLARRLGFNESLIVSLGQVYERWDGKGLPRKLKGDQVMPAVQLVTLAQDAVVWTRIGGPDAAVATVRKRSGGAYHPALAERFCEQAHAIVAGLDAEPSWESVLALEPGVRNPLSEEDFDRSCEAFADFADIKSPYVVGHSPAVAALAAGAGRRCGLVEADVTALRRAGLLHDIGRVGISAGIWGKEAALSDREWEQVRLHAYYTERVLARPESLRRIGMLASQHHERMDGSGYHRGSLGQALSSAVRILAAADCYHAMTEPRPHRIALAADQAAQELRREVRSGHLDGDAVNAVLAEAGHQVPRIRRERPAGLSEREVEVLRLIARGHANRVMAEQLHVSPDTIKHHIQHIYDKVGVSTRAGATLFAMENALL